MSDLARMVHILANFTLTRIRAFQPAIVSDSLSSDIDVHEVRRSDLQTPYP